MSIGWREEWEYPRIIALVELDMQKLRVHIVLSRKVIAERLRELERPLGIIADPSEHAASCRLTKQL
jgi:hypothetical protein